jgi:hypothetical protein
MNFFGISVEAMDRAAKKGIELRPMQPELFADLEVGIAEHDYGWVGDNFAVTLDTPKGHYLWLKCEYTAQIVAVDDYRPSAGTYNDLLPGFRLSAVSRLGIYNPGNDDEIARRFAARTYTSIVFVRAEP